MELFETLFVRLLPLYFMIGVGFVVGHYLKAEAKHFAPLMFYCITPLVIFSGVIRAPISLSTLSLPLLILLLGTVLCVIFYLVGKRIWEDNRANILGLAAGTGNAGYFGLPIAMILFDEALVGIYITAFLGMTLFENTVGFYITAKHMMTSRDAIMKVLKLPSLYAFILGAFWSALHLPIPEVMGEFLQQMRNTYTIMGMMIIGMSMAMVTNWIIGWRFMGMVFLVKFLVWPLIIWGLVTLDAQFFHLYSGDIHEALLLLSIVPIAVNTVVIAVLLDASPEKIATSLVVSTLFALFYVPLMVNLLL